MPYSSKHILKSFEESLDNLRRDVMRMASISVQNLDKSMQGLLKRDDDLCTHVIADDEEVDQLEKKIDGEGIEILMLFQPVASDLRQVISAMKISTNLERVSDLAVNIARKARKLNQYPELADAKLLEPLYDLAIACLRDSIEAHSQANVELAKDIKVRDDEIDKMHKKLTKRYAQGMEENPQQLRDYLSLTFVVRNLERIGDHAKNIAEDAVYAASAEDIRHLKRRQKEEAQSE